MIFFIDIDVPVDEKLINKIRKSNNSNYSSIQDQSDSSVTIKLEPNLAIYNKKIKKNWNRIIGIFVSIISGIGFGFSFTPVLYVIDNYESSSQNMNDYTFSMNSGVLLSALGYFLIYSGFTKSNQQVNGRIFLPSFFTGKLIFDHIKYRMN